MVRQILIVLCFALHSCDQVVETAVHEIDVNIETTKDITDLSIGFHKIEECMLYSLNDSIYEKVDSVTNFRLRDIVSEVKCNVQYIFSNGVLYKKIMGVNYVVNYINIISVVEGDPKESFRNEIEDSVVVLFDKRKSMVRGSNSAILLLVEKIIYPPNKLNHLVSTYLLVENYEDSNSNVLWGSLDYVRERERGGNYSHYGYRLFQEGTYKYDDVIKESGVPPRKSDDQ